MFYTLSHHHYDPQQLQALIANIIEQDALLCWQDGVLLPIKYPTIFQPISHYYLLENDVVARDLLSYFSTQQTNFSLITLADLVKLTEEYHPQIGL
ncbi:hypothetical protein QV06_00890 [Gallibacterium genomosp. 3]|uniref:Sulfur transfer complex subunit TusB n=1 Tax=Gallibacterium genomosp. 3 TaxID=505345 RepID=A0A1A7PVS8_9PAST|nr:DsrH/TusB family sulfur metabolism protein [Gallibacterium genomosp. 3]OBX05827.1 hypothetical protein QV06_00890 [Gallibacterium genomosp. 3]